MKAISEGVASILSLATRKVLRCYKELEHITVISGEGANCKLMKRGNHPDDTLRCLLRVRCGGSEEHEHTR
ncbi:hypothetical protein HPB47_004780 [Ixodes persulcatus]|uniref:Uncharacterized protein n=1 Tax=Ixodes persulcatus TaxID=34615 RepID=A0AC60PET4_IXOPE|nr:hypothetical protein HPB47_004780 [Ixodes persulcatus]